MQTTQQFNEGYEKKKHEGLRAAREQLFKEFPQEALAWLALAPLWPLEFAERGFPSSVQSYMSGESVHQLLEKLEEHSLIQSGSSSDVPGESFYTMSHAQRSFVLNQITDQNDGDVNYLRAQLHKAGEAMAAAADEDDLLSPPLSRWVELARSEGEFQMSQLIDERVTQALAEARQNKQMGSPEALRWIETAESFAKLFRGPLEWAVALAGRKLELFHREAYDNRYLDNYFIREDQEHAFKELLSKEANDSWALHYVGIGGTGKTMLMRRIKAQLAKEYRLATARVDFDHLNPDYPFRAPGLLLVALAEELRLYDEGSSGKAFRTFDREIRNLHERVQGDLASGRVTSITIDEPPFRYVLESFVEALSDLSTGREGLLLMLDTCEELAKVRTDASVPDNKFSSDDSLLNNVNITFRILEQIHSDLATLRVIFAGRRPLACKGYDWTCPTSTLKERSYLRLHIIRGFDDDEARRFLAAYRKTDENHMERKVRNDLVQPIIDQSLSHYEALDKRFERTSPAEHSGADTQHSPFLLDIFAMWASSDEKLDVRKLTEGGPHLYVKERIVDRADTAIRPLLPALALLTQFDQKMLGDLIKITKQIEIDDQTEVPDRDVETIFNELAIQEWIDLDRARRYGGRVLVVDAVMRNQLLEYYADRDRTTYDTASQSVARLLRPLTLERNFSELSVEHFDAALRTLISDPADAALWWSQVEARFAKEGNWSWAKDLTDYLLGDEGPAAKADPSLGRKAENENILRPALLATYAAALAHLNPREALTHWNEVLQKADRHPIKEGALRLKHRAIAGKIASCQWQSERIFLDRTMLPLLKEANQLRRDSVLEDAQSAATEIAMLEALIEMLERSEALDRTFDSAIDPSDIVELGNFRNGFNLGHPPPWWSPELPQDLRAFYLSLKGRIEGMLFRFLDAESSFRQALDATAGLSAPSGLQTWLDWKRPDNLRSRIRLEFARAMDACRRLGPNEILEVVSDGKPQFDSIDSDRLASAVLTLQSSIGTLQPGGLQDNIALSLERRQIQPTCNAHRAFPMYFATALEALVRLGEVDESVRRCIDISRKAESKGEAYVQETIDRVLMRIAFRMRLRDEPRVALRDSLQDSFDPEDVDLRFMLATLDGSKSTDDLKRFSAPPTSTQQLDTYRMRLRHIKARSGHHEDVWSDKDSLGRNFWDISFMLDKVEAEYLFEKDIRKRYQTESILSALNEIAVSIEGSKRQAILTPRKPVEQFTLQIRLLGLRMNFLDSSESFVGTNLIELVGKCRAADIAFEEGTLLALRLPERAIFILELAGKWYKECGDNLSLLLTNISIAMLYARLGQAKALRASLKKVDEAAFMIEGPRRLKNRVHWLVRMGLEPDTPIGAELVDILEKDIGPEDYCQRPWIARLAACIVSAREPESRGSNTIALLDWLNKNYATSKDGRFYLPKEFELLFDYREAQPAAASSLSSQAATLLKRVPGLKHNLVQVLYGSLGVGVIGAAVYTVFYLYSRLLGAFDISMSLFARLGTLALVIVLLILAPTILKLYLGLNGLFYRGLLSTKSPQEVTDLNRPLQAASQIAFAFYPELAAPERSVKSKLKYADLTATNDDAYRSLAETLPEKLRRSLSRLNKWVGIFYLDFQIEVDNKNAGAPWEAIVALSLKDVKQFDDNRYRFSRVLEERNTRTIGQSEAPLEVLILAPNQPQASMAQRGWSVLFSNLDRTPTLFIVLGRLLSKPDPFEYRYLIPKSLSIQASPKTAILHIVGTPSDERAGLKMDISDPDSIPSGGSSTIQSQSYSTSESSGRGFLASAEEIAALFPNLRICIIQCIPANFERRTSSDRVYSARQRRFGAELYKYGIPFVIVLPPIPDDLATIAVGNIAELILSSRSVTRRSFLRTLRFIQKLISNRQDGHEESRLETAFDVCLYADKNARVQLR